MRIAGQPDKRILEQRARIEFHYPIDDMIIFVPMYENPKIQESQTANYVEYNPIGRSSSLFAYTGSKSRKFKVELTYTLPHLEMFDMGIYRFQRVFTNSTKDSQKQLFFPDPNKKKPGDAPNSLSLEVEKQYWILRAWAETLENISEAQGVFDKALTGLQGAGDLAQTLNSLTPTKRHAALDSLLFFIALFRTSVVNKADNPIYGPPLARLTFGAMYQSVPCIIKSYNMAWEEEMGYDLETLTPRRIKINLDMQEVRVGDMGKYDPAQFVKRDNITGWESATAGWYTTDPLDYGIAK
jgi:hypothetical protein